MKLSEFKSSRQGLFVSPGPFKVRRVRPVYDRGCNANEHVAIAELEIAGKRQVIVLVD